jgi:hypothetical protein
MNSAHLLLTAQLIAYWPVWRWYVSRLADTSDEPWGLLALGTALLFLLLHGTSRPLRLWHWGLASGCALTYTLADPLLPPLLRAVIAVTALGCTLSGYCLEGHNLIRLELTAQERLFGRDFPGHIARFTDGSREIIIRWVQRPTRRLHPAADCLKGVGYEVTPRPIRRDHEGRQWGCFDATRQHKRLRVCERIGDGQQRSWSDVSSWYWAAMLQRTEGPWWAMTVAEPHV